MSYIHDPPTEDTPKWFWPEHGILFIYALTKDTDRAEDVYTALNDIAGALYLRGGIRFPLAELIKITEGLPRWPRNADIWEMIKGD